MNVQKIKFVWYSPTGTTKAIMHSVERGINHHAVEMLDITTPEARKRRLCASENELLVVGVPVYMGRVPALLIEWLQAIQAPRTPVVCIVVYGNRTYEDALLELNHLMIQAGCRPIAGAAYIGEHSFSSSDTPIAEARPDQSDTMHAERFGRKVAEKLLSVSSVDSIPELHIPGIFPYRGNPNLWSVDFIAISDACTQCGECANVCPVGAIDPENSRMIDKEKCITCCACIKRCPQKARTMKPGPVNDAAKRLNTLHGERKEPVFFI